MIGPIVGPDVILGSVRSCLSLRWYFIRGGAFELNEQNILDTFMKKVDDLFLQTQETKSNLAYVYKISSISPGSCVIQLKSCRVILGCWTIRSFNRHKIVIYTQYANTRFGHAVRMAESGRPNWFVCSPHNKKIIYNSIFRVGNH